MSKKSIEFLGRIVAAHSVSSKDPSIDISNREASNVVAEMLEDFNLPVAWQEVPDLVDKHNVICAAGPEPDGKSGLLLAGHTDTVPFDEAKWDTDPLKLTEKDGKLYGMGACDMKQFFAVVAGALEQVDLAKLTAPLQIWATAEEECGMEGALHASTSITPCAAALVGEPTSLTPVYGHKGAMAERIVCHGKSAHASVPENGANALEALALVMVALRADNDKAKSNSIEHFHPPYATINFGMCQAGSAFNVIPERAELWLDRRILPGENIEKVRSHVRKIVTDAAEQIPGVSVEYAPLVDGVPPMLTETDARIIKDCEELSGNKAKIAPFCTEAPYYSAAGMDSVVMGAGDVNVIHKPNEHVAIDEIEQMSDIVARLIQRHCMAD